MPTPKLNLAASSLVVLAAALLTACAGDVPEEVDDDTSSALAAVDPNVPIATDLNLNSKNQLGEDSGLIASNDYPGFVWIHRDGFAADRASRVRVYAMKVVNRKLVGFNGASGTYPTREFTFAPGINIDNINWEDITLGSDVRTGTGQSLYIGDIGNNLGPRNNYKIYEFAEPNPAGASAVIGSLQATWTWSYPTSARLPNGDYPNCEALFFLDRNLYVVTKEEHPRIYRFPDGFYGAPTVSHTLVPVTNGSTSQVVGTVPTPSYGSFNGDHTRFVLGGHANFHVYTLPANTLKGDALVKAMLLTPGRDDAFAHPVATGFAKLNTEGATFEHGTNNVIFGTESKMVFHWPKANIER